MVYRRYRKFYSLIKKYPPADRKKSVDLMIEQQGYSLHRIPKEDKHWIIEVAIWGEFIFNDASQTFTYKKAVQFSREIALEHFEST